MDDAKNAIDALCKELLWTASATWDAVLPPLSKAEQALYEWMAAEPENGDIVYASTGLGRNADRICVGKLLRTAREPVWTEDDVKDGSVTEEDLTTCLELVWYIETFDGEEVRWVNEKFRRVPGWQWEKLERSRRSYCVAS